MQTSSYFVHALKKFFFAEESEIWNLINNWVYKDYWHTYEEGVKIIQNFFQFSLTVQCKHERILDLWSKSDGTLLSTTCKQELTLHNFPSNSA